MFAAFELLFMCKDGGNEDGMGLKERHGREEPETEMSTFYKLGSTVRHSALVASTSLWELPKSAVCISKAIPRLLFLMEGMLDGALKTRKSLICQFQELD